MLPECEGRRWGLHVQGRLGAPEGQAVPLPAPLYAGQVRTFAFGPTSAAARGGGLCIEPRLGGLARLGGQERFFVLQSPGWVRCISRRGADYGGRLRWRQAYIVHDWYFYLGHLCT